MACSTSSACKQAVLDYMLSMVGPFDIRETIGEAQKTLNASVANAFDVSGVLAAPGRIANSAHHALLGEQRCLYPLWQQTQEMFSLVSYGDKNGRDVPDNFVVHGEK